MAPKSNVCYRFGPYRLDATDRLLYRHDELVSLPPKVVETLHMFVVSGGRVLGKDEMLKQLWPDTFVEEGTLTQYISLLRKALGEDGHWVENLPRRGYRFTAPVEECLPVAETVAPPVAAPTRKRASRAVLATAALVLPVAAAVWWYFSRTEPIRSVAVLPFVNLSGDARFDYISDGLTEELTHALAQMHGIRVAARTSAFQYRGKNQDVRDIGRRLNVAGVLEGSVRVEKERIRVTAQLIDARTGYHVWSDTYDAALDDLLSIQQRIGSATAGKLALEVGSRPSAESGITPEAFRWYLQGRYFLARGRPETFQRAADAFHQVVAKAPRYARAHSGLADTYYRWALWESAPPGEAFAKARAAAEKALALDDGLAEAHASLANIKFQHDWDYAAAEREFRRSIALNPHRADTWHWFSHLLTALGRFAESETASRRAIELEPFDLPSQNHLGWCHYFAGQFDRAIQQHRRVLELDPVHGQTRLLLGRALTQRGLHSEAIEQLEENLKLSPDSPERLAALAQAYAASGDRRRAMEILDRLRARGNPRYVPAYSLALVYAGLGAKSEALAALDRAVTERSSRVVEMKYEPALASLRTEPNFQAVLKRVGLL